MQIDSYQSAMAVAAIGVQQAQTMMNVQMELVKSMAEMQQAMVEMLRAQGIGNNVDTMA
jgi:hypothetical protein